MSETKTITLNGEPRQTAAATIADLVRELELAPQKVAVERNGEIVPRSTLEEAALASGDMLEIVHFVGAGITRVRLPTRGPSPGAPSPRG
ncbi:sulfur carrier protein ThiS [Erythrobacter sp. JK5]|uniref:sulfur carrier protein ThiS n=1 Tax=Erythrobacter sp. JK5 TaxID=2829500 RepID=UPI001BAABB75|nr:sulfur carrier protein ThiS [Erythrobacter sp. JK5]QUL37244.1 sulfur carrier protein ThiS [Erythrobacter sp. JK5]